MNKKIIWGVVVLIVLIMIVVVSRSTTTSPKQSTEIRIGAVLGLTGYAAADSLNVKRGIDLAVEDLAKSGVTVNVNYQDDGTDPKKTVSAIQYLASTFKPQAVIGPIWSFLEDAGAPTLTQAKIVAYAPADTSEFTTGGPYMFHGAVKNEKIIPAVVEWLKSKNIKSVAIIVSKDGWGSSVDSAFQSAAKEAGVSIVVDDAILSSGDETTVMSADITKAKSLKAGAILFTGYDEEATILAKRRQDLGLNIPVLVQGMMFGPLVDRGTVTKIQAQGIDVLTIPSSPDFVAKFKAKYGEVPGTYSDRAYDGVMLLVDAIQHAPATDGSTLAKYIRDNVHYQGYAGLYEFDAKGDLTGGSWIVSPVVK